MVQECKGNGQGPFGDITSSLQKLKQQKFSTPEALESMFDTKEVLAEPHNWPTESTKYRHRRPRGSVLICSEDLKIEEIGRVGKQKAPVKKNSRLRERGKHREKVPIAGHLKNDDFHHIPNARKGIFCKFSAGFSSDSFSGSCTIPELSIFIGIMLRNTVYRGYGKYRHVSYGERC